MQDNLPELRDIHLPESIPAFPPAYGWWVILAGIIFLRFYIFCSENIGNGVKSNMPFRCWKLMVQTRLPPQPECQKYSGESV